MRTTGKEIKCGIAIAPINGGDATLTGVVIDTKGYESAVMTLMTGVAEGSPSAQSFTWKLQDCATSGGAYTDISETDETGETTTYAGTEITADSSDETMDVDLKHLKRYVKVVATVLMTSGSTPKNEVCAHFALGEAKIGPAG